MSEMKIETQLNTLASIGEKMVSQVRLSKAEISQFARLCGDPNLLHHDEDYARQTRFGDLIVCGPHISSLMMALTAKRFSQNTAMVGLEFSFQFLKAIKAEELVSLEMEVIGSQYKASLGGEIVELKGRVTNEQGIEMLTCIGKIFVTQQF